MQIIRFHVISVALLLCACVSAVAHAQAPALATDINETIVSIPVIVDGKPNGAHMVGTVFKPDGGGPFPFVVLNHGRAGTAVERARPPRWRYVDASRWLVKRGYAVFVATRRGYGETGGSDVETNYNCSNPWYKEAMAGGVESVMSVIEYAKVQPFVNRSRFVVMGQSVGGYLSVGVAAARPDGLVAAINFAGGQGGRPVSDPGNPCAAENSSRFLRMPAKRRAFRLCGYIRRMTSILVLFTRGSGIGHSLRQAARQIFACCRRSRMTGTVCLREGPKFGSPC